MDLAKLDLEAASAEGVVIKIKHPKKTEKGEDGVPAPVQLYNDAGEEIFVRMYNTESAQFKASAKVHGQQYKGQKLMIGSDEWNEVMVNVLADCTIDWNFELNGKVPKCTRDKAHELYSNGGYNWLVGQLFAGSGDPELIPNL